MCEPFPSLLVRLRQISDPAKPFAVLPYPLCLEYQSYHTPSVLETSLTSHQSDAERIAPSFNALWPSATISNKLPSPLISRHIFVYWRPCL